MKDESGVNLGVWESFPDPCPHCGGQVEIFKINGLGCGSAYNSDLLECNECGENGIVSVLAEKPNEIIWDSKT